jgi:N-acetylmuramoyl-L-alanine amidase
MNGLIKACLLSIYILLVVIPEKLFAQDSIITYKINYYQKKVTTYLDKENGLSPFYVINKEGIKIFASAHDKVSNKPEFRIGWDNVEGFRKYLKNCSAADALKMYKSGSYTTTFFCQPIKRDTLSRDTMGLLYGYRIAIDAGHTAGTVSEGVIEKKFLKFKPADSGFKDSIAIAEGMLTYATAALLKEKLVKEGADVFLTRPFNGSTAYGIDFDEWLKINYANTINAWKNAGRISAEKRNWYLNKASKNEKFTLVFKDIELQKRAEVINAYKPDLTIIIHYNVDETNTGWKRPGSKNYSMAFIGGAFFPGDLSSAEKRFEFLRMLLTYDIESSVALSAAVVKSFETNLQVKAAGMRDATYLYKGCLYAGKTGVFCRNLQLTRNVHGTVVYGETLYQDNVAECVLLNQEADKLKNIRIQQAADAYYKGVKEYIENWKK